MNSQEVKNGGVRVKEEDAVFRGYSPGIQKSGGLRGSMEGLYTAP